MSPSAPARAFLGQFLAPLAPHLARGDVTDLYINRPGELWLDTLVGTERIADSALTDDALWRLARQIAAAADQAINREHPLLSATLPDGARVQVCAPPVSAHVTLAVRKHRMQDFSLADLELAGAFAHTGHAASGIDTPRLRALLDAGHVRAFLTQAVQARATFLIAGATGTGKTTFLNALLKEVPADERLILIEDTPEIMLAQPNSVGLVAARGPLGEAPVNAGTLVEAALRLRPDRIVLGELRGPEALAWIRAAGTGHPGSLTTVHASSAEGAVRQVALLALGAGHALTYAELAQAVRAIVDVYVVLRRHGAARLVDSITLAPGTA